MKNIPWDTALCVQGEGERGGKKEKDLSRAPRSIVQTDALFPPCPQRARGKKRTVTTHLQWNPAIRQTFSSVLLRMRESYVYGAQVGPSPPLSPPSSSKPTFFFNSSYIRGLSSSIPLSPDSSNIRVCVLCDVYVGQGSRHGGRRNLDREREKQTAAAVATISLLRRTTRAETVVPNWPPFEPLLAEDNRGQPRGGCRRQSFCCRLTVTVPLFLSVPR